MMRVEPSETFPRGRRSAGWLIGTLLLFLLPAALLVPGLLIIGEDNLVLVFRDPNRLVESPWYYGFYSKLGIVLWSAAAAVCLFGGVLLAVQRRWERALLLLGIGLLTAMLCLDDLYQIHENSYSLVGIPEKAVFASYALLLGVILLWFRRLILQQTQWGLLAFSLAFFVASTIVDLTWKEFGIRYLFEEGPKLIGIFGWLGYWSLSAFEMVRHELASGKRSGVEEAAARAASASRLQHVPVGTRTPSGSTPR
jgi:hypothetical protein